MYPCCPLLPTELHLCHVSRHSSESVQFPHGFPPPGLPQHMLPFLSHATLHLTCATADDTPLRAWCLIQDIYLRWPRPHALDRCKHRPHCHHHPSPPWMPSTLAPVCPWWPLPWRDLCQCDRIQCPVHLSCMVLQQSLRERKTMNSTVMWVNFIFHWFFSE